MWARGLAAGALTTCALLGVTYALAQAQLVSFFPLDVAQAAVRLAPGVIATQGIEALGPGAKLLAEAAALVLVVLVGSLTSGLVVRFGLQRSWSNVLPISAVAIALIALAQTLAGTVPDAISLVATALLVIGWAAGLLWLCRLLVRSADGTRSPASSDRRKVLRLITSVLIGLAAGGGVIGELIRRDQQSALAEAIARGDPVPGVALSVDAASSVVFPAVDPSFKPGYGARPESTPTQALYVVASEIRSPNVDAATWHLTISGLVHAPLSLSYADIHSLDRVDQPSTLTCISNEVGGGLTGTGVWSGVPLGKLLGLAGVDAAATTVVLRSVTGYADAIPLDRALDRRTLVVYGFNGQALAREHGFPLRLIVPGLYGMKNVKWLSGIELVDKSFVGYWEQRGWDPSADVRTQSTIDTGNKLVGNSDHVTSEQGRVVLGGYAFAGIRGISRVELNIDNGGWQPVQLKEAFSEITWRPWRYEWQTTPGDHLVLVRATDGQETLQSAEVLPPHPSGASGLQALKLRID